MDKSLLQLFILRAESELQSFSGNNNSRNLQCLDSLKTQLTRLFGGPITKHQPITPPESMNHHQSRDEIFKPRNFGKPSGAEIKYKGDSMRRPFSSDEIAWLASFLVNISGWLNEKLGLNRVTDYSSNQGGSGWSFVEVPGGTKSVHGPMETLKVVFCCLVSWIMWLGEAVVQLMRSHGVRVNLRMLASKKIVVMVLVFAAFNLLKRAFALQNDFEQYSFSMIMK